MVFRKISAESVALLWESMWGVFLSSIHAIWNKNKKNKNTTSQDPDYPDSSTIQLYLSSISSCLSISSPSLTLRTDLPHPCNFIVQAVFPSLKLRLNTLAALRRNTPNNFCLFCQAQLTATGSVRSLLHISTSESYAEDHGKWSDAV